MTDKNEQKKHVNFLLRTLCGFLIGIGGILPGVSGSVMAVSLGLYEDMLDALADLFHSFRKHILFLLPIGIGSALGLVLGALGLTGVMRTYETQVLYLFLGLVAGGVPSFIREANEQGFKKRYLLATLLGAALASALLLLKVSGRELAEVERLSPLMAILAGAILAVGAVVPGMSTSFILMFLGWYKAAMASIANVDVVTILCLAAGALLCALALLRGTRWLFRRFHGYAYYATLGFLLVSAALIFPGFPHGGALIVSLLLAAGGFVLALLLDKVGK